MKNKDILLEHLKDMDEFSKLKKINCPPIYLLGGSACILGNYLCRATTDFDFIDINYPAETGRLFKMLEKFDMLEYFVTPLAPDYKERAVRIEGFENIEVFVLSREDIIVSKLSRYSGKDIDDIKELILYSDKELIRTIINGVKNRDDFSLKVKKVFLINLDAFEKSFI